MTLVNTSEDQFLVDAAKRGDYQAFSTLVNHNKKRVYAIAMQILHNHQDALDVVQSTFLAAIEHLADFRQQASFSTWIGRITINTALKVLRKRNKLQTVSLEATTEEDEDGNIPHPEYIADWSQEPDQLLLRKETRQLLDGAIDQLDEKYRLVFILRDVIGLNTEETAETLSISPANVKVRLLRARLALRESLTQAFGDEISHARLLQAAEQHRHKGDEDGKTPASKILQKYQQAETLTRNQADTAAVKVESSNKEYQKK